MPKNLPKDSHNDLDFLLISDFASFLHVSTHTVRNLEREFSIEVKKDVNGKRIYTFSDIEKYRKLLERKSNSLSNSVSNYKTSDLDTVPVRSVVVKESEIPLNTKSSIMSKNLFHIFSYIHNFSKSFLVDNLQSISRISRVSVAMFLVVSISSYGSLLLDKFLDISDILSIYGKENYSSKNMSNVLQATNENWEYRFDVNIPAYFNNTLNGSNASFNLVTVGNSVTISQEGVFAPNVINSFNTVAGESLLLVDITDPNNPIISSQNNPSFDSLEVGSLLGVTEIDSTTISTLESSLNISGSTDAQTLQGLAAADLLRSNANTVFSNGIMTYDVSSSIKYNNINPNKFLRVDSSNNLIGFDILPGANVNFTSTANSITIDVNAITTSSQSSSVAVGTLFMGGTTFDVNNLILSTAQDLNKLYTLSGTLISSTNFNSTLFSNFINIDTDATDDIVLSNLSSSILSSFPKIDTDATNDVLLSSLASLMLSNYPNLDTNALDDVDVLQDAVLVTSGSAKDVYSINNWYGFQNFTEISGSVLEVEANGKLLLNPGAIPSDINNALYNYSDRLYFEELPLVQVGSHTQSDHANKFAIFTTDASNRLLLTGSPSIPISALQTGSSLSILGMEGSNLKYLSVGGDLSVNTISSSTISFTLNNVNSNIGTFGNSLAVPTITVNAKGQITSISTSPFNVYYTSNISFSTPNSGSRVLTLQQPGLSNLSSSFTLLQSDIVSALGYTPLRNVTDSLTGDLGVSGNFSASSATFNSIALSNALSVNFGGTGITQTPANGQLIIGNAGGYTLSSLTSGTNVSITTGPGSIILSSFDTTNPNNFITSFSFTDSIPNRKILTINREGLSSISSSFSMSFDDIVSALSYTPQVNLGYTPLRNTTDTLTGSLGVSENFSASLGSFSTLNSTNSSIGTLTLTNALGVIYGGTGLTQAPANGQLLIGNAGGYSLSTLIAGSNVQITTGAGSITISSTDTTNPNNFVTGISFSTPQATQRILTLTREGLSNLTATFSLTSSDITTALGYTPLQASDTGPDKFLNNFQVTTDLISQNVELEFLLEWNDSTSTVAIAFLTPAVITTALGYIPQTDLGYTPLRNTTDTLTGNLGVSGNFSASLGSFSTLNSTNSSIGTLTLTNALGVIYGGTGLTQAPANGQLLIGNAGGYSLSTLIAGSNVQITTGAGSITISSTDTTNPNHYVTGISFSIPAATQRSLVLSREGLSDLVATFSLSLSDITTVLGYTPINRAGDTIAGSLTVNNTLSAATIFQNGNRVCDESGNCTVLIGSGSAGYITYFSSAGKIINSQIFQDSVSNIGIGTTSPGEKIDVAGAIKLSTDMGTGPRTNALYQDGGVLYWNGQAVGVVGSTAPGGISGTKDYFPYFNTNDTLIASDFKYQSTASERGLELLTSSNTREVYLALGHSTSNTQARLGVAGSNDAGFFFSRFESHDDLILENDSNNVTSDIIFSSKNYEGRYLFTFGKNDSEAIGVLFRVNTASNRTLVGINNTAPSNELDVTGNARFTGTLAASTFSNPNSNNFTFLSGANFNGNISAATATLTNLTLANALAIAYGGTGLTQTPTNGQLLIGNGSGYTLASLTAGTNVSITTGAGSITINSSYIDTTGPNNYVTGISFSTPQATQRILTLTREGLSNLTATFSLTSSDITTALGYTPLQASDTAPDKFINSITASIDFISSQNVEVEFSLARSDSTVLFTSFFLTPQVITTALGYTPLRNTTDTLTGNLGVSGNFSASLGSFSTLNSTNSSIGTLTLTNALGVIYGGTGLTQAPANGQILIGNAGGYSLSTLIAGSNVQITTGAGSITISSTDTTNPNNFVTGISFSTPQATQRTLTLTREGLSNLTATFSLTSSDITTALGYTPLRNTTDTLTGSLGVSGDFSASLGSFSTLNSTNSSIGTLTLTNALGVIYGGTGLTQTPANGQILIGNAGGYSLSTLIAGSNVQITTGAGSITISSTDTTNPNNLVTGISFSTPQATQRILTLTREGLSNLTATFSLSSSDITTALGYTPLRNTTDTLTGSLGVSGDFSAASAIITNALSAGSIGTAGSLSAATGTFTNLNATNSSIGTLTLTNALGVIYGGTGLTQTPANGQILIGNAGGYSLSTLIAGSNVQITTGAGSITISSTDTTNPNNFVTGISFSTPQATQRILTLTREGLSNLTATFSLTSSDITTALGYTPVNKAGDTMTGSLIATGYSIASTDLIVADNFFIGDYLNSANRLQIEPSLGSSSRKLVLDLDSQSLNNTTLGLYLQSVKFSSPANAHDKNLVFNFVSSENNIRLDITKTGTLPAIVANVLDLGGASLTGASASFSNLGVSGELSSASAVITNALSAGSFGTLGAFSAGSGNIFNNLAVGGTLGITGNLSAATGSFSTMNATNSSIGTLTLTNALGVIYGGTGLNQAPANGQILIGNSSGGYSLTSFSAGANVNIVTGPGNIEISFSGTGPNNYVTDITFETPAAGQRNLVMQRDLISSLAASFTLNSSDITTALGYTPLRNTTDTLTGNLGVSGDFSAASAVISGNFSAGNSTLANALVLGNLTLSNPSGNTALDFYANGTSGNNIMMRSNFGNQVLAQINQDSTNALEIENFATDGLTNFNFPNNGQFNVWISDTPNNATNKLVLNQTFNNLNLFTNLNVGGTFSAGASKVSSLGVTSAFSAASGSITNSFGVGGRFSTAYATFYESSSSSPGLSIDLSETWGNFGNRAIRASVSPIVSSGYAGANSRGEASWLVALRDAGGQTDNGVINSLIGQQIYWGIYPRTGQAPKISEAIGILLVPYLGNGVISTYAGLYLQSEITGAFDDATVASKWAIYSEWNAPSFFAGSIRTLGGLSAPSLTLTSISATAAASTGLCRNNTTGAVQSCNLSLKSFKNNIIDLDLGLNEILKLRPVEYNWKDDNVRDLGFIAEEVVQINPLLIEYDVNGNLIGVKYSKLNALLTKGIQEQQVQIQNLSNAVSSLNVSSLETLVESLNNTLDSLSMSTENGALVVNSGLTVTGEALFNNATFTGDVAIGQMKFDSLNNDISISGMPCTNIDGTLNESLCNTQTLFVMKNKAGNINFFDGKVLINPNGEMTLEKITVGEVAAAKVSASEYEVMAGSDISGNTKILTGQNEVTILTSKVKENSKIFITPTGSLEGSSIYVDSKLGGVSFTVKLSSPLSKEIEFDWFILNSE